MATRSTGILALLLWLSLWLLPLWAQAQEYRLGDLAAQQPWLRATIGALRNTAGYLTVSNHGAQTQRLVAVEIAGAERVELHETRDGMMMMVEAVEIPPGGSVVFAPGGWHLMVGPLEGPLAEGESVAGVLVFEPAGRLEVQFRVEAPNATESHGAP